MSYFKSHVVLILLCVAVLFAFYGHVIVNINSYIFGYTNDGVKNYYNFIYHIKYGHSFTRFSGWNYPFDELIMYVDLHPLLANVLRVFSQNVYDVSPWGVGIINSLLLVSIIVSALFILKILFYYSIPWHAAILGSIGIAFLASNVLLWEYGHYALSYSCFFPIAWFLLLKYFSSSQKVYYSAIIAVHTLIWFYTHNYMGMIILSFTFFVHLFHWILSPEVRCRRLFFFAAVQILIPIAVVLFMVVVLDDKQGRVEMPYLADHRTSFYLVFLPNYSFLRPVYDWFFDLSQQNAFTWKAVGNYIGASTNMVLLAAIIFVAYKWIFKKKRMHAHFFSVQDTSFLLASVLLLLYAMAFPFRYNLDFLLPKHIRQFVSMGRFAWAFYFVAVVMGLYVLQKIKNKKLSVVLLFVSSLLLFGESVAYHVRMRKQITKKENFFAEHSLLSQQYRQNALFYADDYQAVLPIPYYNTYLGQHSRYATQHSKDVSLHFSYISGLPMVSSFMPRACLFETRQVMQLLDTRTYVKKPVLQRLNDKPFLVLSLKQEHSSEENAILMKSTKIYECDIYELYSYSIDSLFAYDPQKKLAQFLLNKDSLYFDRGNNLYLSDSAKVLYFSFDSLPSTHTFLGKGAFGRRKVDYNFPFEKYLQAKGLFDTGVVYNLSFWYYSNKFDQSFSRVVLEQGDSLKTTYRETFLQDINSAIYYNNWSFNYAKFSINNKSDLLTLYTKGEKMFADSIYLDELLIYPDSITVYKPIYEKGILKAVVVNNEIVALD